MSTGKEIEEWAAKPFSQAKSGAKNVEDDFVMYATPGKKTEQTPAKKVRLDCVESEGALGGK